MNFSSMSHEPPIMRANSMAITTMLAYMTQAQKMTPATWRINRHIPRIKPAFITKMTAMIKKVTRWTA